MICFDIETGPLPEDQISDLFDADAVKVGNLKDPEKIAAKKNEAKAKFLADAALSPLTGQVLAIGYLADGENNVDIVAQQELHEPTVNEADVLADFWKRHREVRHSMMVGFNIAPFDIPFMVRRSFILGVDVPSGVHGMRYLPASMVDLREIWQCGDRQAKGSLDAIDRALGNDGKPDGMDGGDFARLFWGMPGEREQALDYLVNDLHMTRRVAEALQVL